MSEVRLTAAPHPFSSRREVRVMEHGPTLREMLHSAGIDPILGSYAVVFINGHKIPRNNWDRVRPKAGTHVEVRVVPRGGGGGGGKNIFRTVLTIAVVAASFYFGPMVGGALFGMSAQAAASTAVIGGVTAAQIGTALIGAVGLLAINVLAPVKPPSMPGSPEQDSQTLFIEGARNRANPFGVVPSILGRHHVVPMYGAQPFTEVVGDDHYLRMLFVWGVGPLDIDTDELKIGETPLSEFDGVQVEHRQGYADDDPVTLYPDTVVQDDLSVFLGSRTEDPTSTGAHVRTSATGADELGIDISFPRGLVFVKNDGSRTATSVTVKIQYRKVGDSTWLTPNFTAKTFPDHWVSGDEVQFWGKKRAAARFGMTWSVSESAQYEIRVERIAPTSQNDNAIDQTTWSALRTFRDEDPIQSRVPVAKTALRIKASDQLNRVIDEFNGVVTTLGKDWDGNQWVDDQKITNPAALYRHVLQGKANAVPLADSRIDLDTLQDWHGFCVDKGFEFNHIRDFESSVWETLVDVANAGRAAPSQRDGKWSVVIDQPQSVPVSHVTPRNSFDFRSEKAFVDLPHAWRIRFPNEDEGWKSDERRVYRDGFDESNATKFEFLEIPGVTAADQIWKLGRYRAAQAELQPERYTYQQDLEFITYGRGDRIAVTHDVLLVGLVSGRVKSVVQDSSGDVVSLVLDEEVEMEAGKDYGIAIRTVNSGQVTRQVTTEAGTTTEVDLAQSVPAADVVGGEIFGFGLLGEETDDALVIGMRPASDFRAQVVAVPYRDGVYTADSGTVPTFDPNITELPQVPAPNVKQLVSDESAIIYGPGESLRTRVAADIDPLDSNTYENPRIEVQGRPVDSGEPFDWMPVEQRNAGRIIFGGVRDGETWDFRFRFVVDGKLPGPWTTVFNHRIVGRSSPPSGLSGLTISAFGNQAFIRWDRPDEIDVVYGGEVHFRHSPLLTGAVWEESTSIGESARARDLWASLPLKKGTYLAHVFDSAGNRSQTVATVTSKQASVLTYASVDSLDEAPDFNGDHDDTTEVDGGLELITDPDFLWDDIDDFDSLSNVDRAGGIIASGTYEFALGFDFGSVKKVRLTTRVTASSINVLDFVDEREGLVDDWESWDGGDQGAGDVRVEVRHTDDDPNGTSPDWSAWGRLDSAEFDARAFEFRAILTTTDSAYTPRATELGVDAEEVA